MSSGDGLNWKTNVNRAKTKRWVEAKSYSYDGDDWGEADEYGEYGGYDDEAAPAAAPKPTGLRQARKPSPNQNAPAKQPQDALQNEQGHQQFGQPQPSQPARDRMNSFGRGDAERVVSGTSAATARPTTDNNAPSKQRMPPDTAQQNRGRAPSDVAPQAFLSQTTPSFEQARSPSGQGHPSRPFWVDGSRSQSLTNSSAGDYSRREFSHPSAAPQPLQARPPRKSSLGQHDASAPGPISPIQTDVPRPGSQPQSPQQDHVSTPTFIRPADIYRRMQEEKERLSQESSRPSLDTITRVRDESPATNSDSERRQRKPALESVAERKSEYGMEGFLSASKGPKGTQTRRGAENSPKLPEISGFEGFGQEFGETFLSQPGAVSPSMNRPTLAAEAAAKEAKSVEPAPLSESQNETQRDSANVGPSKSEVGLQHQPSVGIRSVVHQAFDSQIPPTPSSTSGSNLDRSNSESTNDISPIISRATSGAAPGVRPNKEEIPSITSIAEEPPFARPESLAAAQTEVNERPDSKDSLKALKQGHRRDMATPSPDNSPARTPNVEANKQLRQPQKAELAVTTPTTTSHPDSVASDKAKQEAAFPSRSQSPTKGRVRDMIGKIDSANSSRRGSESSLREMLDQNQRPGLDTNQSFRPQLPGAWSSYVTNLPDEAIKRNSGSSTPHAKDPMSAVAAAGSALAGAFASAVGVKHPVEEQRDEHNETPEPRPVSARNMNITPETQRLYLPRNDSDAPSSIVPTPMDLKSGDLSQQNYFAPVTPLNQGPRKASGKQLPQLEKTRDYEDMSTESSPNDLESDRLRKELVRELSPQTETFDQAQKPLPQVQSSPAGARDRESAFLPSEYDSYWNGSAAGGEASRKASELGSIPTTSPTLANLNQVQPAPSQPLPYTMQGQHRRSGSMGATEPSVQPAKQPQPVHDTPSFTEETPAPHQAQRLSHRFSWEGPAQAVPVDNPALDASTIAASSLKKEITSESPLPPLPQEHAQTDSVPSLPGQPDVNKQLPQGPESMVKDTSVEPGASEPERPLSGQLPSAMNESQAAVSPFQQARTPAFREIMAIKDIHQRLNAYNTTRAQFASMNTGLTNWIQTTINDIPEHSDLVKNGGSFGPQVRPMQAPSSAQPGPSNTPSPHISKSPFSTGAGNVTSQKGKELLRTAGVFSGKANNAAKGLFSKGRNKLRGMGGDKVD